MPDSNLYDGLFLMSQQVSTDLDAAVTLVTEMLARHGAEVVALGKWDERKLAYPIKGQKRGLYLLGLFRIAGEKVVEIERDCHLSDEVLRVLITRGEHLGEIEIDRVIKGEALTQTEAKLRGEGEEGDGETATAASESSSDD